MLSLDTRASPSVRIKSWLASDRESARKYEPAAHEDFEITWVEQGRLIYHIGQNKLELGPGESIVVPTHIEHATEFALGLSVASVHVKASLAEEIAEAIGCPAGERAYRVHADDEQLVRLGQMLRHEAAGSAPGSSLAVDALAEALVIGAVRAEKDPRVRTPAGRLDRGIAAALDLIETRHADPLCVDQMARAAGMSRFHFSRLFREQTGKSPYQHLVDVRLSHAATALRRGRASVSEVALRTGFADLSRFSRLFRERMGVSPSRYRKGS